METRTIKCPRCGTECKETSYSEYGIGEVESHFKCEYCGYYEHFAYGKSREADDLNTYENFLLPCRPGVKVYRVYTRSWIGEDIVKEWVIKETGIYYIDQNNRMTHIGNFGYRVFLDKEKAEECLKNLKELDEIVDNTIPFE